MSEQWIKAFKGDAKKLDKVVGSKDRKLVDRILESDFVDDIVELLEESDNDLETVLVELIEGKLQKSNAYAYRRVLEHVAGDVMKDLDEEATLPGRGCQDLAPAWKHWGVPTLARVWGGTLGWPWKKNDCEWPIAYVIAPKEAAAIAKELKGFREKTVLDKGVPKGIDRFSDDWTPEDLAPEVSNAAEVIRGWCKAKGDILVWHDGQQ